MRLKTKSRIVVALALMIANLSSSVAMAVPGETYLVDKVVVTNTIAATNTVKINIDKSNQLECYFEGERRVQSYVSEGKYYLLLPSYVDLNSIKVEVEGSEYNNVTWDGTPVDKVTSIDITKREHSIKVGEQSYIIVVKKSENIAAMHIAIDEPLEYIHKDKNHKTTGNMTLITTDGTMEYSGNLSQFKARGNSTFYAQKKPYQIKLENKANLLGMGTAKTWILLANAYDISGLRNKLVYDLAQSVGLEYTMSGDWVDLYINEEYYGNYLLSEKVEVAENRVNIPNLEKITEDVNPGVNLNDLPVFGEQYVQAGKTKGMKIPNDPTDITGGYLLELEVDSRYSEEASGFTTYRNQPVVIKSPEYASENQAAYIADIFQKFEDALYAENGRHPETKKLYSEYFDMSSFIKRHIIDEITKNVDAGQTSCFFYKPAGVDEKVYSGPCWDYDTSLGKRYWGEYSNPIGFGYKLISHYDPENWHEQLYKFPDFKIQVRKIYNEIFAPELERMVQYTIPEYIKTISASLEMNEIRWPEESDDDGHIIEQGRVCSFLEKRIEWLSTEWTPVEEDVEVPSVTATPEVTIRPTVEPTVRPTVEPTVRPTLKPTPVSKIKLNIKTATIYETGRKSIQLRATVEGPSKNVIYTSSNTKVAKVDKNGLVTAVARGNTTITAKANGIVTSCKITVKPTSLKLNKSKATIYTAGEKTLQLKATKIEGESKKVVYISSNSKIAKVDKTGKVTAVKAGTVTISAKVNGVIAKCRITVKKPTLSLAKTKLTVKRNQSLLIKVKATPAKTITYQSTNKKVVTVNKKGVIRGIRPGKAKITIIANGIKKTVIVTVKK